MANQNRAVGRGIPANDNGSAPISGESGDLKAGADRITADCQNTPSGNRGSAGTQSILVRSHLVFQVPDRRLS
jgi:hypothetical protein